MENSISTNNNAILDYRSYRPASILVIDLVKHSKRSKRDIDSIQKTMEEIFLDAIKHLHITEKLFNYTGDGYFCSLIGDSSTRIMDFINYSFPLLNKRLSPFAQKYRAGLDFGLVHLRNNVLTGAKSHFDMPGIIAARLESKANENQILCTDTVFKVFGHHYSEMFSKEKTWIQTKDRKILTYELIPIDLDGEGFHQLIYDYLLKNYSLDKFTNKRRKILIVDDDSFLRETIVKLFEVLDTPYEIIAAKDGREALSFFKAEEFAVVFTDLKMPGIDGTDLLKKIIQLDPNQIVVLMTGFYSLNVVKHFIAEGGFFVIAKPFGVEDVATTVNFAVACGTALRLRNKIRSMDDLVSFLFGLHTLYHYLNALLHNVKDSIDTTHSLIRHKAQHIVKNLVECFNPGNDVVHKLNIANKQMSTLKHISDIVGRVKIEELEENLHKIVEDLKKDYPKVIFEINCSFPSENNKYMKYASATVLIVCELIDNAIEAINGEGKIEINISLLESSGKLNIFVHDSGDGIKNEFINKVFNEGFSTRGQGRGLGLSLIQETVNLHYGKITYSYDRGAIFKVELFPFC
jgi:CheY-like chemotaxis protein